MQRHAGAACPQRGSSYHSPNSAPAVGRARPHSAPASHSAAAATAQRAAGGSAASAALLSRPAAAAAEARLAACESR